VEEAGSQMCPCADCLVTGVHDSASKRLLGGNVIELLSRTREMIPGTVRTSVYTESLAANGSHCATK